MSSTGLRLEVEPRTSIPDWKEASLDGPLAIARLLVQWSVDNASHHYVFRAGAVAEGDRGILLPAPARSDHQLAEFCTAVESYAADGASHRLGAEEQFQLVWGWSF
jgi:hypothetical protein